jgi:outer membrane protein TolC
MMFSFALSVEAQQQALRLDMATVATEALASGWSSKQAHQDAVTADSIAKRAASLRWGRVDFQSQYLRLNDPIKIESPIPANLQPVLGLSSLTTPLAPQDNLHVNLQAGVPIFTGGKITNAIREAKAGARAANDVANDTDAGVVFEAERDYLSVLLTSDIVRLNESALDSYKEHLNHADSAFRQGTAAKYDVIRAEAAVTEQEKRLIEARNQYDLAVAALRTALVLTDSTPIEVAGKLFEIDDRVDLNQAMDGAVSSNPMLRAVHEKITADKSSVRVQQGDYLPQITGIAGRELVTNKLAQTDPTWFVGARATLELFDGGERHARVSEARSRMRSSELEYHNAEDQLRLAVRSAYLDMRSQESALASARKTAELAQESLRLATKRFEVGTGTSLEVLDANVSLTAALVGVQRALYGIDLAYLTIHRYEGDVAQVAIRIQKP